MSNPEPRKPSRDITLIAGVALVALGLPTFAKVADGFVEHAVVGVVLFVGLCLILLAWASDEIRID